MRRGVPACRGDHSRGSVALPLILVVVLSPLPFGSNRPWAWSLLALVTGALLARWGWRLLRSGEGPAVAPARVRGPAVVFLLVCLYVAAQAVPGLPAGLASPYWRLPEELLGIAPADSISIAPAATLTALMRLLTYGAVFWLALQSFRRVAEADRAVAAFAIAAGAYAAYGLLMHFLGAQLILWYPKWDHLESVTGTFPNRNHFATFTGLGLLCALAWLARQLDHAETLREGLIELLLHSRPGLFVVLAAVPLSVLGLILSQSRAGVLSTMTACDVFFAGLAWRAGAQRSLWLALLAAFLLPTALYLAVAGEGLVERLAVLLEPGAGDARFPVWREVLAAIVDHRWLGIGYGAFEDAFRIYRPAGVTQYFDTAHSSYLENALELGVPAAAALCTAILWPAIICLRALGRRHPTRIYAWAAACATLLVGCHAAFDYSLQIPAVAIAYAAILGVGCTQSWSPREDVASPAHA